MSQPVSSEGSARAFSLMELVFVTMIIAIMASIAMPRFSNAIARLHADAAARRVVADLALARRQARTSTTSQTVSFDAATSTYRLVGMNHLDHAAQEYEVSLSEGPYQATLVLVDFGGDTEVVFNGYGMPDTGGFVLLQVGGHQRQVNLDADTAQASVP